MDEEPVVQWFGVPEEMRFGSGKPWSRTTEPMPPNGDFVVKVQYAPGPQAPESVTLGFTVEPFGDTYLVPVRTVAVSEKAEPVKP